MSLPNLQVSSYDFIAPYRNHPDCPPRILQLHIYLKGVVEGLGVKDFHKFLFPKGTVIAKKVSSLVSTATLLSSIPCSQPKVPLPNTSFKKLPVAPPSKPAATSSKAKPHVSTDQVSLPMFASRWFHQPLILIGFF